MMDCQNLERTADIVAAHVSNNKVAADQLPQLIDSIFKSLSQLGASPPAEERTPAVTVASSLTKDTIVCLECGAKFKSLKRHLHDRHGLSADDYRVRWGLGRDYPMVTRGYSAKRAELARVNGLGRRPSAVSVAETALEPVSDAPADDAPAPASVEPVSGAQALVEPIGEAPAAPGQVDQKTDASAQVDITQPGSSGPRDPSLPD
jgi:predicted transcriptional regulator